MTIKNPELPISTIKNKSNKWEKTYADYKCLWSHKKTCKANEILTNNNDENIHVELDNTDSSQYENTFVSISPAQESAQESVPEQSSDDDDTHITNEMMCKILKELCISNAKNTEFQAKFFEFMKEKQFSNNITNNNVQINIDTFLNQYCKDAPSMNDFIKNIKVSVEEMF